MIVSIVVVFVVAACGGGTEADPGGISSAAPSTGTLTPEPVELGVTIATTSTTTASDPSSNWALGGTVTAQGILEGSFDVFPMCDVRNDADGEFLNIAFGYQNLDDPAEPTVRVVAHVRGWRDQVDFDVAIEVQYQTGTGMNASLQDAAGTALVAITFIDSVGEAAVARIDLEGSFDGAASGTVRASLTCIAA